MASSPLPVLLPPEVIRVPQPASFSEWTPKSYLNAPQAPPMDDAKSHDLEMAAARQMMDGKALKKTRPRRTVDYAGGMGRWNLVSTEFMCLYFSMALIASISRPVAQDPTEPEICPIFEAESTLYSRCTVYSSNAIRQLETSTEWAVLQLLPPKAYPDNASTSLCTNPPHRPVLLPSGVVSTSPPYAPLANAKPEFVPHRPMFLPATAPQTPGVKDKEKGHRHAALIAHLSAELREDGGSWENVVRECRRGRGGYQRS